MKFHFFHLKKYYYFLKFRFFHLKIENDHLTNYPLHGYYFISNQYFNLYLNICIFIGKNHHYYHLTN